jgi:hypothetical protein
MMPIHLNCLTSQMLFQSGLCFLHALLVSFDLTAPISKFSTTDPNLVEGTLLKLRTGSSSTYLTRFWVVL